MLSDITCTVWRRGARAGEVEFTCMPGRADRYRTGVCVFLKLLGGTGHSALRSAGGNHSCRGRTRAPQAAR